MSRLSCVVALLLATAIPDLAGAQGRRTDSPARNGYQEYDRVTDATLFGGVAWYLASNDSPHMSMLPFAIMALSSIISYQRAKAESLGLDAKGGLMERAERIILLCFGLLFSSILVPVLWVMLVLTAITAVQRFVKVWRQAEVAPVTEARRELRRNRRKSRRIARSHRMTQVRVKRRPPA